MILKLPEKVTILFLLLVIMSCGSKKDVVYFKDIKDAYEKEKTMDYNSVFKQDDLLAITVLSSDMMGLEPFNLPSASFNAVPGSLNGEQKQLSYLIRKDGSIEFPVLGKIKIAGFTNIQVTELIKKQLSAYIKNPIVHIELVNFRVTVLGEVHNPGTFIIPSEKITIIEAIGLAGDLTITGKRKDILVIREQEGKHLYYRVDLTSEKVFSSPVYYLEQSDAIYVSPNSAQVQSSSYNKNTPVWISVASVVLSLAILLAR